MVKEILLCFQILERKLVDRSNLATFFVYPEEIRKIIYTTNTIESFNRCLRKYTKTKVIFPSDSSLEKSLYLAMKNVTKRWT